MIHRRHRRSAHLPAALCLLAAFPGAAPAQETAVACIEGVEPLPITYGSHTSGCTISPASDIDRFSFVGMAGDHLRISAKGNTDGLDPSVQLVGPDGVVIGGSGCTAAWYESCSFAWNAVLETTGMYELRMRDGGQNETGSYTLQLERMPPLVPPPALRFNETVSGSISPPTDIDFRSIQVVAGTTVNISAIGQTNGLDSHVEIVAADGTIVESRWCTAPWYETCSFNFNWVPETSGTYALAIHEGGYNETGNYTITLQCVTGNCACFERDIDGDGAVGFQDLLQLLYSWGECEGCPADLYIDGTVDFNDLLLLLNSWGPCG